MCIPRVTILLAGSRVHAMKAIGETKSRVMVCSNVHSQVQMHWPRYISSFDIMSVCKTFNL